MIKEKEKNKENDIDNMQMTLGLFGKIIGIIFAIGTVVVASAGYILKVDEISTNNQERLSSVENKNIKQDEALNEIYGLIKVNSAILDRLEKKVDNIDDKIDGIRSQNK